MSDRTLQKQKNVFMIHSRCPSQFTPIFDYLVNNPLFNIFCICCSYSPQIETSNVNVSRLGDFNDTSLEKNTISVLNILGDLQRKKIRPNIILMHVGFGYDSHVRTIYPDVPIIGYFEWYYPDLTVSNVIRNDNIIKRLEECSVCITPTNFQRNVFPPQHKHKLMVIHEGIDIDFFSPLSTPPPIDNMLTITYVTRGFEPMRRFMDFIRASRLVLERMENVRLMIAGIDKVFYTDNVKNISLKAEADKLLQNVSDRVTYRGWISKTEVRDMLRQSDLHVYYTHPFVLSWSMLEAMAVGCPVVGAGEPVEEFVQNEHNGFIVEPENLEECYRTYRKVLLMSPDDKQKIKTNARNTVIERIDSKLGKQKWTNIFNSLI